MGEEPLIVDETGAALEKIAVRIGEGASTIIVRSADKIRLAHFEKEKTLFDDEATVTRTDSVLDYSASEVTDILIDKEDGHFELWGRSPHYAGAAIVIRGTTYEYVRRLTPAGAREYIEMIKPTKRRK